MNTLYRNNGNSDGWLRVKCEGRVSNRAGLGAKLRVKSTIQGKSFWQLRQITANETQASFGLGDATNIDIVRIEWPSGIVQQFTNVTPKQFMTVREPSRLAAQPLLQQGLVNLTLSGAKGQIYPERVEGRVAQTALEKQPCIDDVTFLRQVLPAGADGAVALNTDWLERVVSAARGSGRSPGRRDRGRRGLLARDPARVHARPHA